MEGLKKFYPVFSVNRSGQGCYLFTMETNLEQLQYPVGRFQMPGEMSETGLQQVIRVIATFPNQIAEAVEDLGDAQLDTPYRPQGWTVRQLLHHCADSHMNGYIRFKNALTEDNPTIKPYDQDRWADLPDSLMAPEISLAIITGVHQRWIRIMQSMQAADWLRTYFHPEHNKQFTLAQAGANYEWHCRHHLEHILSLRRRMHW